MFYIFRPEELPNPSGFIDHWQSLARAAGLPGIYFVAEMSDLLGAGPRYTAAAADGFDASVYMRLPARASGWNRLRMRMLRKSLGGPEVYPYSNDIAAVSLQGPTIQPCVYPNWDNTPRSRRAGLVLTEATPEGFRRNVVDAVAALDARPIDERLLWVKSWNEWAEGNHLEPDLVSGRAWLEALQSGLTR